MGGFINRGISMVTLLRTLLSHEPPSSISRSERSVPERSDGLPTHMSK